VGEGILRGLGDTTLRFVFEYGEGCLNGIKSTMYDAKYKLRGCNF
jgi:hypothetical protein